MQKIILLPALFLFLSPLAFGQSRVVQIEQLSASLGAAPTVTFRVYWTTPPVGPRHLSNVWLFVDYLPVFDDGTFGTWTPATISSVVSVSDGTASYPVPLPYRGFYLQGNASGAFSSTVTVALQGLDNVKFSWCAYASDYPPNATEANGYYALHGAPPFTINTSVTEASKTYTGGCITELTDATGCPGIPPAMPAVTSFTVAPNDSICFGESVTLTTTTNIAGAASYSFAGGAWTTDNSATFSPSTTTDYTVVVRNIAGCTATTAPLHVTVLPLPVPAFVSPPSTACAGSSVTLTASGGGSYCFTEECENCIRNPYETGNDSAGAAHCYILPTQCSYTADNTYTVVMPESGSVTVWVKVINEYGCVDSTSTVITAIPLPTLRLLSAPETTQQIISTGISIVPVQYAISGATGATVAGLPDGVTYTYTAGNPATLTISGTPLIFDAFTYTITVLGNCVSAMPVSLDQRQGNITIACLVPQYDDGGTFEDFDPSASSVTGQRYTLTDARDGKRYNVVKIGARWIMAQNLNYQQGLTWQANSDSPSTVAGQNTALIGHFWCPGGYMSTPTTTTPLASCDVWGALYSWETAMLLDGTGTWTEVSRVCIGAANSANCKVNLGRMEHSGTAINGRGICPPSWHVPTDFEWAVLLDTMESGGGTAHQTFDIDGAFAGTDAGSRGKASCNCPNDTITGNLCVNDMQTNWYNTGSNNGTDDYGLRIIPSGYRNYHGLDIRRRGDAGFLSSSSMRNGQSAWFQFFSYNSAAVYRGATNRSSGFAIRCIRNE
ncbi:MAG: hypothetical protein LBS12_05360 [Prevotellaceae bacterium]|jgi:uncharacterized protein (TIGR02145 family)|nr:hypothetical protein [Prevotellaceae bacterium]